MDSRTLEVKALSCLVHQPDSQRRLLARDTGLRLEYFANPHVRTIARALLGYTRDYSALPSRQLLIERVRSENPQLALADIGNLDLVVGDLFSDEVPGELDFVTDRLRSNWKKAQASAGMSQALQYLEHGEFDELARALSKTARSLEPSAERIIRLDPFGADFERMIREVEEAHALGEVASEYISTGLPWLDEQLDGGYLRGEVYDLIAHTGRGKSLFGTQAAYAAALNGHRVVKFSLEMKAKKTMCRMFARITGIPTNVLLRKPWLLDPAQMAHFKAELGKWRTDGHALEVRSWDRRPTMEDLRFELESLPYDPDLVIVDQITDVARSLDWEDMGAVALDLQLLAKGWANERGLAVLTFLQAKRGTIWEPELTTEDSKYGGAPAEWATVVMYITQTKPQREDGVLSLGIAKNRDGAATDEKMVLYPRGDIGRIHCFARQAQAKGYDVQI